MLWLHKFLGPSVFSFSTKGVVEGGLHKGQLPMADESTSFSVGDYIYAFQNDGSTVLYEAKVKKEFEFTYQSTKSFGYIITDFE